ncbi:glycogen debranching enzyme-like [Pseudoliparis swirei]|uniref:glycogen debranching enzyme-like n=1 Tax=Pseudoliparis swirei TaxID=2059687 RepID=UPI0024BE9868|nr:glycogen debranching enzyme-like [Pseudoliparis swirei]
MWISCLHPESTSSGPQALRSVLWQDVYPHIKLWEFFQLQVDEAVDQFRTQLLHGTKPDQSQTGGKKDLRTYQDPAYHRYGNTLDMDSALQTFVPHSSAPQHVEECCGWLREKLNELNEEQHAIMQQHLEKATNCIVGNVVYEHLADHGPKLGPVSRENPLVTRYFTFPHPDSSLEQDLQLLEQPDQSQRLLAHNGWVMGDDPLRNFAEPGSQVYLRRELVCWGDSAVAASSRPERSWPNLYVIEHCSGYLMHHVYMRPGSQVYLRRELVHDS